jgi:ubiquinone/menaquinone biosynthesis C-methylase UbiE
MPKDIKSQIKEALETYNKYAEVYAEYLESKLLQYQLHDFVSRLHEGAKILDVGCGAGRDLSYFAEDGFNALGIDMSDSLIKICKDKKLDVKKMDLLKMTFKAGTFDGLWCMATFSDIPKKEAGKALKEFAKVLKEKGVLYLAVKEGKGEKFVVKEKYGGASRFYALYTKAELVKLIEEAGFEIGRAVVSQDKKSKWVEIYARKK